MTYTNRNFLATRLWFTCIERFTRHLVVVIVPINYKTMLGSLGVFYMKVLLRHFSKTWRGTWQSFTCFTVYLIFLWRRCQGMTKGLVFALLLVKGQQHKVSGGSLQCWHHCLARADPRERVLTGVRSVTSSVDSLSLSQTYQLRGDLNIMRWALNVDQDEYQAAGVTACWVDPQCLWNLVQTRHKKVRKKDPGSTIKS